MSAKVGNWATMSSAAIVTGDDTIKGLCSSGVVGGGSSGTRNGQGNRPASLSDVTGLPSHGGHLKSGKTDGPSSCNTIINNNYSQHQHRESCLASSSLSARQQQQSAGRHFQGPGLARDVGIEGPAQQHHHSLAGGPRTFNSYADQLASGVYSSSSSSSSQKNGSQQPVVLPVKSYNQDYVGHQKTQNHKQQLVITPQAQSQQANNIRNSLQTFSPNSLADDNIKRSRVSLPEPGKQQPWAAKRAGRTGDSSVFNNKTDQRGDMNVKGRESQHQSQTSSQQKHSGNLVVPQYPQQSTSTSSATTQQQQHQPRSYYPQQGSGASQYRVVDQQVFFIQLLKN